MVRPHTLSLIVLALLVAACTPSHTADKSRLYARQVGFTDNYEIQRWHHRQFSRDSRILVSASATTDLDREEIIATISRELSPYFAVVDPMNNEAGLAKVRDRALVARYGFVLDIARVDWQGEKPSDQQPESTDEPMQASPEEAAATTAGESPASPEPESTVPSIKVIEIEMRLVDVATNQVADKFVLRASSSWTRQGATSLQQVLAPAIAALGEAVTGP